MRSRGWVVLACLLIVWAAEVLADAHRYAWVRWTHKQAMDVGGLGVLVLAIWLMWSRRD